MKNFFATWTGALVALASAALAMPQPAVSSRRKKADAEKVGYLAAYWTTDDESVYFALSANDAPLAFKTANGGNPVLSPTLGTKAIRDVSLVAGVGEDVGKYFLIGTDLDIGSVRLSRRQRVLGTRRD